MVHPMSQRLTLGTRNCSYLQMLQVPTPMVQFLVMLGQQTNVARELAGFGLYQKSHFIRTVP